MFELVLRKYLTLFCFLLLLLRQPIEATSAHYSLNLTGIASGTAYTIAINIGTLNNSESRNRRNTFRLIADTGSSNDAVLGSGCCGDSAKATYSCDASSTCTNADNEALRLAFAGANIQGKFMTDVWSSSEIGNIPKTFLVIEQQDTFYRSTYDGITGLAYEALAASTEESIWSLYNVLVSTGRTRDAFGMLLCGTMQPMLHTGGLDFTYHSGQLMIGGSEGVNGEVYYTGDMLYTPITREAWYVVTVTDIGYNGVSLGFTCDNYNEPQAILDSGTSNLAFPSNVYNALMHQIRAATLAAIPDFDPRYFDDSNSCCDEYYCDPTSSSTALLNLPSIYFTLGMEASGGSTSKHFIVEISPEYYWRPEMNGANFSAPCRAIGISEGTSTVLGDVFMDGLYTYHDRTGGRIGIAVADNCPNHVNSSKKVYVSDNSKDWCSCFSNTLKKRSVWSTFVPGGSGCFFFQWWMYIVVASFLMVLICICVLIWWQRTKNRMEKLQQERLHTSDSSGARTTRLPTMQLFGSNTRTEAPPTPPPYSYYTASATTPKQGSTRSSRSFSRQDSRRSPRSLNNRSKQQRLKDVPMIPEPKSSSMSSLLSPLSSRSSIALLSEPHSSVSSMGSRTQRPPQYSNDNRLYSGHSSNDRWGAHYKEDEF